MKTKLDRLESRLNAAGIATRRNYIQAENGKTPVLIADHDYTGPYPTRETWGKISTVDRIATRYKGLCLERRGYYQATFIREEVSPA